MTDLVAALLDWTEPKRVGSKVTSICHDPTREFWDLWKEHKDELKEAGIRVGRDDDDHFYVTWVRDASSDDVDDHSSPLESTLKVTRFLKCPPAQAASLHFLHPDQRDAVWTLQQAIDRGAQFTLDASEAGIGKTWINLAVAARLGINFGVVCPANVVTKWTDTAISDPFNLEPEFVLSYEKLRTGRLADYCSRVDSTYRGKPKTDFHWNTIERVAIIFDEVHYGAAPGSLNAKLLKAAIDNPHVLVMGLSATASDSPLDMKTTGYGLGLHNYKDWWSWCQRMGCRPGPFGGLLFNVGAGDRKPTKNQARARVQLAKVHAHIFPKRGVRITVGDAQVWRPKNQVMAELVDVDDRHPKIQAALDVVAVTEEADEEKAAAKETAVCGFVVNTRDRQRTELLKLPIFLDRLKQLRAAGNSVIVFLNYSPSIALLSDWVKEPHSLIVGGLANKARDEVMRRFQDNEVGVCICQTDAGAQSIDLDDLRGDHPRRVLISPHYSAKKFYQAIGRAFRPATTKSLVMQWVLFAVGTVEERVGRVVQQKLNGQALINDGDLSGVVQVL